MKSSITACISPSIVLHPFGMLLVGRNWTDGSEYGYGFNGKEYDDEVAGNNIAQDFGARIYDTRLGRWLCTDPEFDLYPNQSPYIFSLNNPIFFEDMDGGIVRDQNGNIIITITETNAIYNQGGSYDRPDGSRGQLFVKAQKGFILDDQGNKIIVYLVTDTKLYEQITTPVKGANGLTINHEMHNEEVAGTWETRYNCTGNALTNQQLIIPSGQLKDDFFKNEGYDRDVDASQAEEGDVGLYFDQNGVLQHLEIFVTTNKVSTKGGVMKDGKPQMYGTNEAFKVGSKPAPGMVIVKYEIVSKDSPNTEVLPIDFMGPPSQNQVITNVENQGGKRNKLNFVNNNKFNQIQSDVQEQIK